MPGYLSFEHIVELIRELNPPLVEGVDDYQLVPASNGGIAEGPCVEIRIGTVFLATSAEIPILNDNLSRGYEQNRITRYAPEVRPFLDYQRDGLGREFVLGKGESVLVQTIERINLPNSPDLSLLAMLIPRFSLCRMGLVMLKSDADPGYSGNLVVGLANVGLYDRVTLGLGARIAKLRFANVVGLNPLYIGKYGGQPGNVLERTSE